MIDAKVGVSANDATVDIRNNTNGPSEVDRLEVKVAKQERHLADARRALAEAKKRSS
jgi:hypothetical protein